jgi:hypothetical protein
MSEADSKHRTTITPGGNRALAGEKLSSQPPPNT